jgi:hypothetical protein
MFMFLSPYTGLSFSTCRQGTRIINTAYSTICSLDVGISVACFCLVWVKKSISLRRELDTQYGSGDEKALARKRVAMRKRDARQKSRAIAIHGGENEAEGCCIQGALAGGYIHKHAK